jgi:catalase
MVREVFDDAARERFVGNVAGHLLGGVSEPILEKAFEYWKNVDADTGKRIEEAVRAGQGKDVAPGPTEAEGIVAE